MVVGNGAAGNGAARVEPLDEDDPETLGPYVLLGRLGQGGMGTVYLGRHVAPETGGVPTPATAAAGGFGPPSHGGADGVVDPGAQDGPVGGGPLVAVKMIRPDLAREPEFRERFGREATAARRVARFCTAEVLDVDVESRRPYLVTEYIEGRSLAAAVRADGPLPSAEVERLAVAVASALTAIHAAGLVHRDLKPGNVMLSPSGARVIDFGIARALDAATTFTHTGLGTPAFMAPEQALGGVVAAAADIYAWGGVVLFAATGRLPHGDGPSPVVLYRAVNEEPDLTGLEPGLRQLVARAMAKDPKRRPTAQELLLHLVGARPLDGLDRGSPDDVLAGPARTASDLDEARALAAEIARDFADDTLGAQSDAGAPGASTGPSVPARPAVSGGSSAATGGSELCGGGGPAGRSAARRTPSSAGTPASGAGKAADAASVEWPGADPPTREATTVVPAHLGEDVADVSERAAEPDLRTRGATRRRTARLFAGRRGPAGATLNATLLGAPLTGHVGAVAAVAFAPDGGALASAGDDGTVRRWRLAGGPGDSGAAASPAGTSRGHEGRVLAVAYAPDGTALATGGSDHTVRVWREPTAAGGTDETAGWGGDGPATGFGHTDQVTAVAFSPLGGLLATASLDGTARLWDLVPAGPDWELRQRGKPLVGHLGKVLAVAFSPDGGLLATAGTDHTALLWDVTGTATRPLGPPLDGHRWHVQALAFSPDGRILVTGAGFGTVRLWELDGSGHPAPLAQVTSRGNGQVRAVALSADGRTLASSGGIGAAVALWNLDDPARPEPLGQLATGHVGAVRALAFSPASEVLATTGDSTIRLWQPS